MHIVCKREVRRLSLALFAGMALVLASGARADEHGSSEKDRAATAKLAFGLLSDARYAYRPQRLDDALSSRIFDAYVDALDPRKELYREADLQALEKYRSKLDDAIKRGELAPIYEIADVRQRAGQARCQALTSRPDIESCQAAQERIFGKDAALEVFLNAYFKASDGRGSYKSPFVEPIAAATSPDHSTPSSAVRTSVIEVGGQRIGVISVRHLHPVAGRATSVEVSSAIGRFNEDGIGGVVLDLRGNQGGPLRDVVDLAGLFLGPVPVMQIRETGGRVTVERSNVQRKWEGALAVLVDRKTAAGAEMLAAALQDQGRGVLVGEQSFGSGTIQNPIDLDSATGAPRRYGSMTLTIAEVFRLGGQPLDGRGVVPDVRLPEAARPEVRASQVPLSKPIAAARGYQPPARSFAIEGASLSREPTAERNQNATDAVLAQTAVILSGLIEPRPVVAPRATVSGSLQERYLGALQSRIVSEWRFPEGAPAMAVCRVRIRQLPGGEVIDIAIDSTCPEDTRLRGSVEAAIIKASPLPYAGFESVFTRDVVMNFKAELPTEREGSQ